MDERSQFLHGDDATGAASGPAAVPFNPFKSSPVSQPPPGDHPASERLVPQNVPGVREDVLANKGVGTPARMRARGERRPVEQRILQKPVRLLEKAPGREWDISAYVQPPQRKKSRSYGELISFVLCVIVPTAIAAAYYGMIASNQYVTEFRFSVQDSSLAAPSLTGLTAMLGGGSSNAALDNYMVADYLTSAQAVQELDRRIKVKQLYSRPNIDWWARFESSQPTEKFLGYWQKMVTASYDQISGLATAKIRAFSPEDALLIGNSLVKLSEELINGIANRSNTEAVRFAENEVERLQERMKQTRTKLLAYRNKVGVIDPTTSVVAGNSTIQTTLQASLATLETQLAALLGRHLLPSSPAVQTLQNQIKATKDQLSAIEATVGGGKDRAGGAALSTVIGEYEQLAMEQTFAQTMVTTAMGALDQARANAAAQHLYITPYVRPSLPESSTYPRRGFSILMTAVLSFICWVIGLLVVRSIRERFV